MPYNRMKKFQLHAEKIIERRGKMQIAKTTETTDKFLPEFTSDSVSALDEIFHVIATFFNAVCRAEIFPCNQPLRDFIPHERLDRYSMIDSLVS